MRILVTSGPTREPIDKIRFITNQSSGRTGAALADSFVKMGHTVTFLYGQGSAIPTSLSNASPDDIELIEFSDFSDLDQKIQETVRHKIFDVIVHLAAVSDFSVEKLTRNGTDMTHQNKIQTGVDVLELRLKPNYKILTRIKSYANYNPLIVGFKLTYTEQEKEKLEAIKKIFSEGNVDFIVHNDLKEVHERKEHRFHVFDVNSKLGTYSGPQALAEKINQLVGSPI
jgi:phosphopantothenoylcysteine synthetase/decarboxylase